jgi:hypothetical protein
VRREQDAEKDRKKRMADPFYLGGPSKSEEAAAVLLEEHEVESIPIFRCFGDGSHALHDDDCQSAACKPYLRIEFHLVLFNDAAAKHVADANEWHVL